MDKPPFVRRLKQYCVEADEALELTEEQYTDLQTKLEAIDRSRARSAANAQFYVIYR